MAQCKSQRKADGAQCTIKALDKYGYDRCWMHLEAEQKIKYKQVKEEERELKGLKKIVTKKELNEIISSKDKEIEILKLKIETMLEIFGRMKM